MRDFCSFSTINNDEDTTGSISILGKGSADDLKFKWIVTDWSACSQSCGGGGFQMRAAQCMVQIKSLKIKLIFIFCMDMISLFKFRLSLKIQPKM